MGRRRGHGSINEQTKGGRVRWRVRLRVDGVRRSLGLYDTEAEAVAVLEAARAQLGEIDGWTLRKWGLRWLNRRERDGLHRNAHKDRSTWRCVGGGSW